MKNPLSKDERLDVVRALGHDLQVTYGGLVGHLTVMDSYKGVDLTFDEALVMVRHSINVTKAVSFLASEGYHCMDYSVKGINETLQDIEFLMNDVRVTGYDEGPLATNLYVFYLAIYNIAKNAVRGSRGGQAIVDACEWDKPIPGVVFDPGREARKYVRFSVLDNGKGFDRGMPLEDYLRDKVSTKGKDGGFGLYLTTLVCKYLGAPLGIESRPGQTRVSIYHPMDLNEE